MSRAHDKSQSEQLFVRDETPIFNSSPSLLSDSSRSSRRASGSGRWMQPMWIGGSHIVLYYRACTLPSPNQFLQFTPRWFVSGVEGIKSLSGEESQQRVTERAVESQSLGRVASLKLGSVHFKTEEFRYTTSLLFLDLISLKLDP